MRPYSWIRLLPFLSGLALTACLSSSGGGSSDFSLSASMDVVAIDRQAHTITTRSVFTECQDDGTGTNRIETSVDHYSIAGGRLVLWSDTACKASLLNGSSSDIVGTWKGTGIDMESPIPAENRPSTCPATLPPDTSSGLAMMSDLSVTYTISDQKVDLKGSGTMCAADEMAKEFIAQGLTLVSKTCTDVTLKAPDGNPLTVRTSFGENKMTANISYRGKSCGYTADLPVPGYAIDCAKQKASLTAYQQCVQGMAGAKVSAALRKVSAKLF